MRHVKAIDPHEEEPIFHSSIPLCSEEVDPMGSPYYMAPEIIVDALYDPKCDIWSIGCVLYLMLTNVPPFNGLTDAEVIAKI